jgi:hypothetical protein
MRFHATGSSPPTGSPESPVGPRQSHRLPRFLLLLQRLSESKVGFAAPSEYCLTCVDPLSSTGGGVGVRPAPSPVTPLSTTLAVRTGSEVTWSRLRELSGPRAEGREGVMIIDAIAWPYSP